MNTFRDRLARAPGWVFALYAMVAGFSTYFCMYAFRKPFAAAEFKDETFFGTEVALKTAFVISQIIGYTLSKYAGIKVVSEMQHTRRAIWLAGLIIFAELALLLFAVLPGDSKFIAIFLNGIPLGMVWGLVVSYLEGRKTSELLLAGLSCSFIVASGAVKDVGRWLMSDAWGVSEVWMPFVTGAIFLIPFILAVWMLNQLPRPDEQDVTLRAQRAPMDGKRRILFLKRFLPGLLAILVVYFFLTAFRDFRDNYGVELFDGLGYKTSPAIFTRTEVPVAVGVMIVMALLNLVKNNKRGLLGAFLIMIAGALLLGGSTLLWENGKISGVTWMVCTGLGSYLAYVPFNSVLFERMIAYTRFTGTAVFAIYLADALGYTGSVGLQLFKDLGHGEISHLSFFTGYSYFVCILTVVLLSGAAWYFMKRARVGQEDDPQET